MRRVAYWVWPLLWFLSIFATSCGVITVGELGHGVSVVTGGMASEDGFRRVWQSIWWIFVKGWHATEFAIFFFLLRKAWSGQSRPALLVAGLYAIGDEAHQLFVPHRGCRASDVLTDWLGICTAWLIVRRKSYPIWMQIGFGFAFVALLYLMSVHPFGLIELTSSQDPFSP